jgi:hypothetical protein
VTAQLVGTDSVRVTWRAGGGDPATGYTVTGTNGAGAQEPGGTTAQFDDLEPGTYTFTVVAQNGAGESAGAQSGAVTVEDTKPATPTGLEASRRVESSSQTYILVTWAATPGATTYEIVVAGVAFDGAELVTGTRFIDDNDRTVETNYCGSVTYSLRSLGADGTRSDPATVTLGPPPGDQDCTPEVQLLSVTANADDSITAKVDCIGAARGPQKNSPIVVLADGAVVDEGSEECGRAGSGHAISTITVAGLDPGTTYAIQARVSSLSGTNTSNTISVTTP